jgi:aspartate/glutamate racemase
MKSIHWCASQMRKHEKINALQNYLFVTNNDSQKSTNELILEEFESGNYQIEWINAPIKELQMLAVTMDVTNIENIINPCNEVKMLAKMLS